MKIKEKHSKQVFEIYGIYWKENRTFFCCFPKNSKGLSSYAEEEVEVVDAFIGSEFVFFKSSNMINGIFQRILVEDELLDLLFEFDPQAYDKFIKILGKEP